MLQQRLIKDLEQRLFDLTLALYRVTDFFPPGEILRKHLREKANEIFSQALEYNYTLGVDATALKILGRIESIKGYLEIAKSLRFVKPINLAILEREYIFLADFFVKELEALNQTDKSSPLHIVIDPKGGKEENVSDLYSKTAGYSKERDKIAPAASTTINIETKPGSEVSGGPLKPPIATIDFSLPGKEEKIFKEESLPSWQEFSRGNSSLTLLLNERQGAILEHLKQARQAKVSDFYSFFNNISSKTIQRDLQDLVAKNLLKKDGEKRWTTYYLNNISVQ